MFNFIHQILSFHLAVAGMFSPGFLGGAVGHVTATCNGSLTTDTNGNSYCTYTSGSSTFVITAVPLGATVETLVQAGGAGGGAGDG